MQKLRVLSIVLALVFTTVLLGTTSPAQAADPCSQWSTEDCATIPVDITAGYCLDWDAALPNPGLSNTGFTVVLPNTNPLTDQNPVEVPEAPALKPSKLSIVDNQLNIVSTKGIMFSHPNQSGTPNNTNSQVNGLGVGVAPTGAFSTAVDLYQLDFTISSGNNSQQAGVWFGINEDEYVKLVVTKDSVVNNGTFELAADSIKSDSPGGATGNTALFLNVRPTTKITALNTKVVRLMTVVDPTDNTVRGFYQVSEDGGATFGSLVQITQTTTPQRTSVPLRADLAAGTDLNGELTSPVIFAGVFATQRNAAADQPITAKFDNFCVQREYTPEGVVDEYNVQVGQTLTADSVLVNDTDENGDALTAALEGTAPTGLTFNADGSFSYTAPDTPQVVTFQYTPKDRFFTGAATTVTINVTPPNATPVANDDPAFVTDEEAPLNVAAPGVLDNDTDSDGPAPLTAEVVGTAPDGLTLNADGSFDYTPPLNFAGTVTFDYRAVDGLGNESNTATATITVNNVNDAPVLVEGAPYEIDEDIPLTVNAPGLLANTTDPDTGETLTVELVGAPVEGLTLGTDGGFTFIPLADTFGAVTFQYRVSDGEAFSNAVTVTINVAPVNDAPLAADEGTSADPAYTAYVNVPLIVEPSGVLANDGDVDNLTLTAAAVTAPTGLTLAADGNFTYTAVAADENTVVALVYAVSDGAATDEATAYIQVLPQPLTPIAQADTYSTDEDTPSTVDGTEGVLANDVDGNNDPLTAALVGMAPAGLTLNTDGSFTYTPAVNFNGVFTFQYTASDGTDTSDPATVTITVNPVNDAPVAQNDSYLTTVNTPLTINAADGVLTNDSDVDSAALTVELSGTAPDGLTLNADGGFTYTPGVGFSGNVTFDYTVSDGTLTSSPATVTITVNSVDNPPVAENDAYTTNEDTPFVLPAPGVLENDTDDAGIANAALVGNAPAGLSFNPDGGFTYTPAANFSGVVSFQYTANDGTNTSSPATVTITVSPVNDAPAARNDSYTVAPGGTLSVPVSTGLLANDTDVDSTLTVSVAAPPMGLTLNANGSFIYTPPASVLGAVTFDYTATDGALSDTAMVTITVTDDGMPPVAQNLLMNGGFENDLTGWQLKRRSGDKVKADKPGKTFAYEGSKAFVFKGSTAENAQLTQKVTPPASVVTGSTLNLELYTKAKKAPKTTIKLVVKHADGSRDKLSPNLRATKSADYVALTGTVTLTDNPSQIVLKIQNRSKKGKVFIDAVKLTQVESAAVSTSVESAQVGFMQ